MDKNDILLAIMVFVAIVLGLLISNGYDKYSYNEGFYDGLNSICKGDVVLIDDLDKFYCDDILNEEDFKYENTFNWT